MAKNYRFYQNRACEYFPCHAGVDEADFNCLFCYCPLYVLGKQCGGTCAYTDDGIKDCSSCAFPHEKENYDRVIGRYDEIRAIVDRIDRGGA